MSRNEPEEKPGERIFEARCEVDESGIPVTVSYRSAAFFFPPPPLLMNSTRCGWESRCISWNTTLSMEIEPSTICLSGLLSRIAKRESHTCSAVRRLTTGAGWKNFSGVGVRAVR